MTRNTFSAGVWRDEDDADEGDNETLIVSPSTKIWPGAPAEPGIGGTPGRAAVASQPCLKIELVDDDYSDTEPFVHMHMKRDDVRRLFGYLGAWLHTDGLV